MRAKFNAALADFAQLIEAEELEPPGVGKNASLPRHEAVQRADLADCLVTGPQIQVISVAEKNLDAKLFENVLRHTFYRSERADRHEDRSLDFAVRCSNTTQASRTSSAVDGENAFCHSETLLLRRGI